MGWDSGGGARSGRWGRGKAVEMGGGGPTAGRAQMQGGEVAAGPAGGGCCGRAGKGAERGPLRERTSLEAEPGSAPPFLGRWRERTWERERSGVNLGSWFELLETKAGSIAGETSFRCFVSPPLSLSHVCRLGVQKVP